MIDMIKGIGTYIDLDDSYISILLKMLGITYVADFSAGICKDAGYQTIAGQIEIFGKLAVMVLSMPVLYALLNTIRDFLT
jgi:stage III sporulation protein AD